MSEKSFNDTACSLLGFLIDRPQSGWDLSELVTQTIGNFWHVTRSQVYRELRTLEEHGQVTGGPRGPRARRVYTITEAGRATFRDWIVQEPGDYLARVPMLMTVWFGDHVPEEDYEWFLRIHLEKHRKKAAVLRQLYAALPDKSAPQARALRFGVMFEEAVLSWFATLPHFGGREELLEPGDARPEQPLARFEDEAGAAPRGEMGAPQLEPEAKLEP